MLNRLFFYSLDINTWSYFLTVDGFFLFVKSCSIISLPFMYSIDVMWPKAKRFCKVSRAESFRLLCPGMSYGKANTQTIKMANNPHQIKLIPKKLRKKNICLILRLNNVAQSWVHLNCHVLYHCTNSLRNSYLD